MKKNDLYRACATTLVKQQTTNNKQISIIMKNKPCAAAAVPTATAVGTTTQPVTLPIPTVLAHAATLSDQQQLAFDRYLTGKNIFITGPGGCGKSNLLRNIYDHATNANKNIQVTALTGCAAVLLECKARTIHSWGGIGLGNDSVEVLVKRIRQFKCSLRAWTETQILVVDEVSMMSRATFDLLDAIGRCVRNNPIQPFGGIQLVFSGDFFQLPPVGSTDAGKQFCFQSAMWETAFGDDQYEFTKIFRQTDIVFTELLQSVRKGVIDKNGILLLKQCLVSNKPIVSAGANTGPNAQIEPTKLLSTKTKVDAINKQKLLLLGGTTVEFNATKVETNMAELSHKDRVARNKITTGEIAAEYQYMLRSVPCATTLTLAIGAQVMCIVNIRAPEESEEEKAARKKQNVKFVEPPLLLCNGSQGVIIGWKASAFHANSSSKPSPHPIVKFDNGEVRCMIPHLWPSARIPGLFVMQIPLILSWAITIHKSQGGTLGSALIDAGAEIFDYGQTYVALSRVKSLEGLHLASFDPTKIRANPIVMQYYQMLNTRRDNSKKRKRSKHAVLPK